MSDEQEERQELRAALKTILDQLKEEYTASIRNCAAAADANNGINLNDAVDRLGACRARVEEVKHAIASLPGDGFHLMAKYGKD